MPDRNLIKAICLFFLVVASGCTCSYQDNYIMSLQTEAIDIEPIDSLDIEEFDKISADEVIKVNDSWLLLSSRRGEYNLLFLNMSGKDSFYSIKKGRGPGEMINGSNLHMYGAEAVYYDMSSSACVSIDLLASVEQHDIVLDTLCDFTALSPKPVYMTSCRSGYVSGNVSDSNVWYSLYAKDGSVVSNVEALNYDELLVDCDLRTSVMLSSKYASSSDGSKVCVANVASPSLSFANVEGNDLVEYRRYEISPPDIQGGISENNCSAFMDVVADDDYVFLLYSGRSIKSLMSDSCNHLVVYDWDGTVVKYFYLTKPICSMCMDGKTLIGISSMDNMIYKYSILF